LAILLKSLSVGLLLSASLLLVSALAFPLVSGMVKISELGNLWGWKSK